MVVGIGNAYRVAAAPRFCLCGHLVARSGNAYRVALFGKSGGVGSTSGACGRKVAQ